MRTSTVMLTCGIIWSQLFTVWIYVEMVEPRLEVLEEAQGISFPVEDQ